MFVILIIIVFWLGSDRPSGLHITCHIHSSLLTLFRLFVLFHSCCSYARVFGKKSVHEFLLPYGLVHRLAQEEKIKKRKEKEKMFIQIKNIWYYNVYMHKLKLSINYFN